MIDTIGTLNEQPLHAALKKYYAGDTGVLEKNVDGYIIDVYRGNQLIEIQTQKFSAIRQKIIELVGNYNVLLVYPVVAEKWLLKLPRQDGGPVERRKSPQRGTTYQIFSELVSMPELLQHRNFAIEIVSVDIEEVRRYSGEKTWAQNGWHTVEQRLLRVVNHIQLSSPEDLLKFLPETLPDKFTTSDIETYAGLPRWLAQKMAYCLRKTGVAQCVGKRGRFLLYQQIRGKTKGDGRPFTKDEQSLA